MMFLHHFNYEIDSHAELNKRHVHCRSLDPSFIQFLLKQAIRLIKIQPTMYILIKSAIIIYSGIFLDFYSLNGLFMADIKSYQALLRLLAS